MPEPVVRGDIGLIKSTVPPRRICFLLASSLLEGTDRGMVLQEAGWGSAFSLGIDELHPGLEKLCGSVQAYSPELRQGRWFSPSTLLLWHPTWRFHIPARELHEPVRVGPEEGHENSQRVGYLCWFGTEYDKGCWIHGEGLKTEDYMSWIFLCIYLNISTG